MLKIGSFFTLILIASSVSAQVVQTTPPASDSSRLGLSVSPLGQWTEYSEPGVMRESGFLYGARVEWQTDGDTLRFNWDSQLVMGRLRYQGKNWSGQSVQAETQDLQLQTSPLVGLELGDATRSRWLAFVGPRLRYWNQTILAAGGYPRELTQIYLPLTLRFEHGAPDGARFRHGIEYAPLLYGEMVARLSAATNDLGDMRLSQARGVQLVLLNDWEQTFDGGAITKLGTYLRSTEVEKSSARSAKLNDQTVSIVEPANRSIEVGVSAGLSF